MSDHPLRGVIAAVATPVTKAGEPDVPRFLEHARRLLDEGCDGLNVLGTTGEATSFTVVQRLSLMEAAALALPRDRLMVGTGAAALGDAVTLTQAAAALGFSSALLLPPFYYKGASDEGLFAVVEGVLDATVREPVPLYLYNFPAMTGLTWSVDLVSRLLDTFPGRVAGLKDSSGDLAYARTMAALDRGLAVFPSNEATLPEARDGTFAGCISATANLNAALCAKAYATGDSAALAGAVRIRALFDGKPLVAAIKGTLAQLCGDTDWQRLLPPLRPLEDVDLAAISIEVRSLNPSWHVPETEAIERKHPAV